MEGVAGHGQYSNQGHTYSPCHPSRPASLLQRHISAPHTASEAWDTRLWLALSPGDTMEEQVIGCMADVLLKRRGSNELDGPPSASLAVAGTGKLADNALARSHPAASGAEEPCTCCTFLPGWER